MTRLPIIGVMGSGSEPHADLAAPLGAWLATLDVHLLTGAGRGTMTAVTRAFAEVEGRSGLAFGICPSSDDDPARPREGYPNPWVEVPIRTHLPLSGPLGTEDRSRNHINVLSSSVIVALPGSAGTASEVRLAGNYGVPLIGYLRRAEDIPEFPNTLPWSPVLDDVREFVLNRLQRGEAE